MREVSSRSMAWAIAAALVVGLATSGHAATVVDLDTVDLGDQIGGPEVRNFFTAGGDFTPVTVGTLTSEVWHNDNEGVFTYTYLVEPQMDNISEFNTGVAPLGFTGTAGWSFSDASASGGPGDSTAFSVVIDDDGTIDWMTRPDDDIWFDSGDAVTFFYQSTLPPDPLARFNLIDGKSASALGIVPIPEPASGALLGLAGLAMLRRRRRAEKTS